MNKKKTILIIIGILLLILISYTAYYLTEYYPAEEETKQYLNNTTTYTITQTNDGIYIDTPQTDKLLIFYPGAKVEYTAYLPLLTKLSRYNIDCYITKMPFNLAILEQDKADKIIKQYPHPENYIAGHSLGAVMATNYVHKNPDKIKAVILLAGYPTEKIEKPLLSIYGTEDKILNQKQYIQSKKNMPTNYKEHIINGANHAQYAYYTQQKDGQATITRDTQINQTIEEIQKFIQEN